MSADLVEIVESLHVSGDDSAEIHSHLIPKEFIQCMNWSKSTSRWFIDERFSAMETIEVVLV